jgi:gas vesicle protein
MFSRVRIAIRFFFVGLAVGILLAPRSGEQTRRMVREKADRLLNDILDAASLGVGAESAPAEEPTTTRRSGNGRGSASTSGTTTRSRSRSTAGTESAEEAASEAGV